MAKGKSKGKDDDDFITLPVGQTVVCESKNCKKPNLVAGDKYVKTDKTICCETCFMEIIRLVSEAFANEFPEVKKRKK